MRMRRVVGPGEVGTQVSDDRKTSCGVPEGDLIDLAWGKLSPEKAEEVRTHTNACAECAAEFEVLKETRESVSSVADIAPTVGFHARLMDRGGDDLRRNTFKIRAILLAATLPPMWVMCLGAQPLIDLLYDDRYVEAGWMLQILAMRAIVGLVTNTSDRTKLYILLMLNCGMTQKDVADLQKTEVDWDAGYISRKRSKTRQSRTFAAGFAIACRPSSRKSRQRPGKAN